MDRKERRLNIDFSSTATADIEGIFNWNVERNGLHQAELYRDFLLEKISELSQNPTLGHVLSERTNLRWLLMKWSTQGYGHIAVYQINHENQAIEVVHIFHTSQNWRNLVDAE